MDNPSRPKPVTARESNDTEAILEEARKRAAEAEEFWGPVYDAAEEDAQFEDGLQWDAQIVADRARQGQPSLTLNPLPQYVDQVLGDLRRNSPSIHVSPTDDAAAARSIPGRSGDRYTLAKVYEGLCRQIERDSHAEAHYDRAVQGAVQGGIGWLRVYATYAGDETFDQVIRIKSVPGRRNVLLDPHAHEPDRSDAAYGFVFSDMPREHFERLYPDAMTAELGRSDDMFWRPGGRVRVAEYYSREPMRRALLLFGDGRSVWEDEVRDVLDELQAEGVVISQRSVRTVHRVRWRLITGQSVLEGPRDIPCSTVPLVPVVGKETFHGGRTHLRGVVRHAKDAVRARNYWLSAATERVALAPKAPWVASIDAIRGHEDEWRAANIGAPAVLPYNPGPEGPPQRVAGPAMPAAELQLVREMTDLVKSTVGMYDASLGARSNEQSGKAILARDAQAETQNFAYADNLARAVRRVGLILCEMIPRIYDTERVVRILREDGSGDWVRINQAIEDAETGRVVLVADMGGAKMSVDVKSGPGYSTQRMEAVETMLELMRVTPRVGEIAADILARNMDWPGADELTERLRKVLPPGMLQPREGEEPPPPPEPTPAEQAELLMAQAKMAEAQARIAEAQAPQPAQAGPGREEIAEMVRDMVAEAMADLMSGGGDARPQG